MVKWSPIEMFIPKEELASQITFKHTMIETPKQVDNMIEKAKQYAIESHNKTAHQYNGKPYKTHLEMVYNIATKFISLLPI